MLLGAFLGSFFTIIFASCTIIAYNLGKRSRKTEKKTEISREDEAKLEKANQFKEGFQNIMDYNINVFHGKGV